MRSAAPATFLLLVAASSLAVALQDPPSSDSPAPQAAELQSLRAEIAELERRLAAVSERQTDLEGEVARLDLELALQQKRAAEAGVARQLAAGKAEEAERAVARLEGDLEKARADLSRRLAGLYRLGRQGYVRLLLAAEPGSDVLSAVRWIRYLARRDRAAIERYEGAHTGLARERDLLVARRGEVESWAEQERRRGRELTLLRRRHGELLAEAERERLSVASRAVELADKEQRLAALIDELYGSAEAPPSGASLLGAPLSGAPLSGAPLQDFHGALEWPAAGGVSAGFGPRVDPRYNTRVPHHGIDLETTSGAAVKAVYPGKVLFADEFRGYGPTVILHHAGRAFTLYAGLSELRVKRGDMLSLGSALGSASDRLYFEIRIENQPEDPLTWLRPR